MFLFAEKITERRFGFFSSHHLLGMDWRNLYQDVPGGGEDWRG